jgi:hypothetical protein
MSYENNENPVRRAELEARTPRILDAENLLHAVAPEKVLRDGSVKHSYFSRLEMSVDKASRATPEQTCLRLGGRVAVGQIIALDCRNVNQVVAPDPIEDNDAHSLVYGKKTNPVKKYLGKKMKIVRSAPEPAAEAPPNEDQAEPTS